ncbi:hypothetical protein [Paenibacillus xylanivorans]|uniref:YgiT-type zinc finger domain-containing protein n=1 Tax=Paenibacillus xylanivorans TaxID=1705561 RepID=A0A0M9BJU3_9BACL|nr:hypothetical protein [Paenibacillus xylanivorans]KOY13800.1 hypothetical protein AMS66_25725 [Paenibacillus xylanivorans]
MTRDQHNKQQARHSKANRTKSTAYDFLFVAENNEYDEIYKGYIDEQETDPLQSVEEIWGILYGEVGIEKRKEKYQEHRENNDYGSSDIIECPMCGNNEVPIIDIEVNVKLSGIVFKSISLQEARCTMCNELFFSESTANALMRLSSVFDKLFPNIENK